MFSNNMHIFYLKKTHARASDVKGDSRNRVELI